MNSMSDYNIDTALYILPRYLHQLEAPGADFAEVRLSASQCMEEFIQATDGGKAVKLDRTKWLILRALLKALETSLGRAIETSYASTGDGDLWESNRGIFTAIEKMDKIHVQYFEGSTPTSLRITSLRRHPETASLQREVDQYKKQVEELKEDLRKKSEVVDSFVLQSGFSKTLELQSQLRDREEQLRLRYSQWKKEKGQLEEQMKQLQKAKQTAENQREKMEEERKELEEKYEKTFKELMDAQKFREDMERELEKLNQQLEGHSKLQEEVKSIVQRIEHRQEDFIQEVQELHLEAVTEAPGSRLSQLPPGVNALCMQIEYFIGVQLSAFGRGLLGGGFNSSKYETDGVCFATPPIFWSLIQDWLEQRRDAVTEQNLRTVCARLRYNPLERVKMSDEKKRQLEGKYPFLVRNVLLQELELVMVELHVYDLEGTARNYVMRPRSTAERVKRLLQVVFSWGDAGFDHLLKALSQSHPDFVARELASGMQQEVEEEAPVAGDAAVPVAATEEEEEEAAAGGEGGPDREEQLEDMEAELPGAAGLSVDQLARVMMTLCRTVLRQPTPRSTTPPAP